MNNAPIYRIVFIAVLGGFLFGLNMAGISGAVNSIKELFSLTDNGIGLMVSALTAGCLVGALFTGGFADRFGRRRIFLAVALLFVISSAGCALSYNPPMLTLFRFLSGLAVGADSVIGPMYISEIAPAGKRGRLVSFQQFAITIGILAAYLFDYLLLGRPDDWRWMLAVPALFGTVFLVASFFSLPESPRWQRGTVRNDAGKVAFRELFSGRTGRVVALGTLLAAFQQITGINAVINYAPIIFEHTGVGGGTALLQSCLVGFINFLSTIVALWLVDTKGRRTLLLWGAAGMILSLGYLTMFSENMSASRGYVAFACVIFGRGNPPIVFLAALLFGFIEALGLRLQKYVPSDLTGMAPYLVTVIMMVAVVLWERKKKNKAVKVEG